MSVKMNIRIIYTTGEDIKSMTGRTFDDWFDFADFVKQVNLSGKSVTIVEWNYVKT